MAVLDLRIRARRRLLLVLAALLTLSIVGGVAWAFWSASGSGTGTALTGTLGAPTGVTAASAAGSGSVSVGWTAPSGTSPQGYYVRRTRTSDGTTVNACGSSPTALLTALTCIDAPVAAGTYTYTVVAVRGSWTAVSSASGPVTVTTVSATATTLSSSANPSVVGQQVTFTATVTSPGGTPTGSVTFSDGGSSIACAGGTATLGGSGTATCQVSYPAVGSHVITATYGGAAGFATSTSSPLTQSVGKASTTTSLTSSANPSQTGEVVTYTAVVSPSAPGSGTPTGSVAFTDGGSPVTCAGGTQTLTLGTATCQVTYSSAGQTHTVAAVYSGDAGYLASTSSNLTQTVAQASTSTALTSSANPAVVGQSVTFTATVTAVGPGSGTPTGSVTVKDGAAIVCTGTLSGGTATCTGSFDSVSTHSVTAVYAGDAGFTGSTSSVLSQIVGTTNTTTTLTSSQNPVHAGQVVTYTATVATAGPGSGTPTGTVVFKDGGTPIACANGNTSVQSLAGGVATCRTTYAAVGPDHAITADYSGDAVSGTSSGSLAESVVSAGVAGIIFTNVKAGTATLAVTCSGVIGTTYTCTGSAPSNASVSATVVFTDASGNAMAYSVNPETVAYSWVSKQQSGNGSVSVAGGASASTTAVTGSKQGAQPLTLTATFSDGASSFTAVLTVS